MTGIRHSADNLNTQVKEVLRSIGLDIKQFIAICTDSPAAMVKMRRELCDEFPHLVDLPCILHAFNLIAKGK